MIHKKIKIVLFNSKSNEWFRSVWLQNVLLKELFPLPTMTKKQKKFYFYFWPFVYYKLLFFIALDIMATTDNNNNNNLDSIFLFFTKPFIAFKIFYFLCIKAWAKERKHNKKFNKKVMFINIIYKNILFKKSSVILRA